MREIRQSGSEGGAAQINAPFLPLSHRVNPRTDHHFQLHLPNFRLYPARALEIEDGCFVVVCHQATSRKLQEIPPHLRHLPLNPP